MLVIFDPNKMYVEVKAGILETYTPNEQTKELCTKVEALKEKVAKFKNDVIIPEIEEIHKLVQEINKPYLKTDKQEK